LFDAKWAEYFLSLLQSDPDLGTDSQIQHLRSQMPEKDYAYSVVDVEDLLSLLLGKNSHNRMAANLKWLKDQGIPVIYTPFVESDDRNKWHAKQGSENAIKLYRLVHDYFKNVKGLDNIIWAYHTTSNHGALEKYYPGDAYVDALGKSAYGTGLIFSEYRWAVEKKKKSGKVIWWSELGIRGSSDPPRDCMDVVKKLEKSYPELAGFVFWSDDGHYNVLGKKNGAHLMTYPKIITLEK
jgi:hypothetical protein